MERIAIVTGAGSGIGRSVALALGKVGYKLVLAGRRRGALEAVGEECVDQASDVLVLPTDVTDPNAVRYLFDEAVRHFGRVDLLFNNAGINVPPTPFDQLRLEDWQRVIDVNLTGAFICIQHAFRVMKAQSPRGGRIINNGSISAHSPRPDSAPYTASKHGITGLTKCASLDGRRYDIACGQIDIGNVGTDISALMVSGAVQADGSVASEPVIDVAMVGDAIVYMDSLPLEANVQFMTLMATKMPFVGRG